MDAFKPDTVTGKLPPMESEHVLREYHDRRRAILSILDVARPDLNRSVLQAWPALTVHRQKLTDAMQAF
ncbi:hypothetical protein, partial [Pantoea agglomerans]|uniref:hypothetical protein n=1 Tax=Enterobacter agglomerans TaxID=549 RepID=UPI002B1D61B1